MLWHWPSAFNFFLTLLDFTFVLHSMLPDVLLHKLSMLVMDRTIDDELTNRIMSFALDAKLCDLETLEQNWYLLSALHVMSGPLVWSFWKIESTLKSFSLKLTSNFIILEFTSVLDNCRCCVALLQNNISIFFYLSCKLIMSCSISSAAFNLFSNLDFKVLKGNIFLVPICIFISKVTSPCWSTHFFLLLRFCLNWNLSDHGRYLVWNIWHLRNIHVSYLRWGRTIRYLICDDFLWNRGFINIDTRSI